jgi:hypothetical protein
LFTGLFECFKTSLCQKKERKERSRKRSKEFTDYIEIVVGACLNIAFEPFFKKLSSALKLSLDN